MFKAIAAAFRARDKRVEAPVPEPTPEKVLNISEPVISFVRIVKESPGKFRVKRIRDSTHRYSHYVFVDKINKKSWVFYRYDNYRGDDYNLSIVGVDWLTRDEIEFIQTELTPIFERQRLIVDKIQRERMKRIYN